MPTAVPPAESTPPAHRLRRSATCLAGMRSWMRGNLDWSRTTARYASAATDEATGTSASSGTAPESDVEAALMDADR